jgi:K+-transporting ATPase ATPase C chain
MKKFLQVFMLGIVFIIICGFAYPLLITGISQIAFHNKANGSMIEYNGVIVGSELIGQDFKDARFFHGRVSAVNYDTFTSDTKSENILPSSGSSNYAVSNPDLTKRIKDDVAAFMKANPGVSEKDLPADLFTSSFSGLDPDISVEAAGVQVDSISKATGIDKSKIEEIVKNNTQGRDLGVFGETRVNVLKANLDIYKLLQNK